MYTYKKTYRVVVTYRDGQEFHYVESAVSPMMAYRQTFGRAKTGSEVISVVITLEVE